MQGYWSLSYILYKIKILSHMGHFNSDNVWWPRTICSSTFVCRFAIFFNGLLFVIWSSYFPVFQCVIYKLYVHFPRFNFHKLAVFFLSFSLFAVTKQKNAFVIKLLFLILVVLFCSFWSLIHLRIVIKDRRPFKMC